jgi:uncharacterized protein YwgA/O-acetyl-ADP-ribose deacetylase (regulator of RNase III)
MSVKVLIGDLFESEAQTLVNTVNCVGVMGKGIALEFKKRFPEMYQDYVIRCERGEVRLGKPYLYKTLLPPWILNFPTKDHWRSVARIDAIVEGLDYLVEHYQEWGITSLAIPPLGTGQGQLEWRVVGPTLIRHLKLLAIPVELYAPHGTPHEELQISFLDKETNLHNPQLETARIKPAWVVLVEILKRVEEQKYHWPVGHTIFQKLAYVATEEGLPTGLVHTKSSYGPFSSELKNIMARLINNGLIQEHRSGPMLELRVGATYKDARNTYASDIEQWESLIDKVTDLFSRLNTNQSEIVATVLYAARQLEKDNEERPTEEQVLDYVMDWKQKRRPPLDKETVAYTIRNLAMLGWLDVKASNDLPLPEEYLLDY